MDQNNQNQQPTEQPQQPTSHESVSTVQQPTDAQPTVLPTEAPAQTDKTNTQPAMPDAPVSDSTEQQTTVHTAPSGNGSNKKPLLLMVGVIMAIMLFAGGIYIMSQSNRTQRLGMEMKKTTPAQPTVAPTVLPEEQELNDIDLGNLEKDLQELTTELNTLQ